MVSKEHTASWRQGTDQSPAGGGLWTWGKGNSGQLGRGDAKTADDVGKVTLEDRIKQVRPLAVRRVCACRADVSRFLWEGRSLQL